MKSIKPGRAPSWGGVVGGIIAAVFGITWTVGATSMGAPGFFTLFGIMFVLMALGGTAYNLHNATSKNRFSKYDVTDQGEEVDPLEPLPGAAGSGDLQQPTKHQFCPFCGIALRRDYKFCPKCGRDI